MTEREMLIQKIIELLKQVPAERLRTVYIVAKEICKKNTDCHASVTTGSQ